MRDPMITGAKPRKNSTGDSVITPDPMNDTPVIIMNKEMMPRKTRRIRSRRVMMLFPCCILSK